MSLHNRLGTLEHVWTRQFCSECSIISFEIVGEFSLKYVQAVSCTVDFLSDFSIFNLFYDFIFS